MRSQITGEQWLNSKEKRAFDITVMSVITPLLGAASVLGATMFFIENGINPIFIQQRLGKGNEKMNVLKLRSMPFVQDQADSSYGIKDERATRVGRVLRTLALDEAPQLLHIINGHMSIVGPRPLLKTDIVKTRELLGMNDRDVWDRSRLIAKPGWLSGFGNLSRSLEPQSEEYLLARVEHDCAYAETASLAEDIGIINGALGIGSRLLKPETRQTELTTG